MKRLMLTAMIGVMASSGVYAADLGLYAKAPPPAGFDWSGFYVGGHVGGAFQTTDFSDPTAAQVAGSNDPFLRVGFGLGGLFNPLPDQSLHSTSVLGGFQAGVNYQIGHFVVGSEVEMSWTDLKSSSTANVPLNSIAAFLLGGPGGIANIGDTETFRQKTNWIATSTVRLGYARDNWLFYSKVGAAWEDNTYTLTHTGTINTVIPLPSSVATSFAATGSDIRVGWTVGTGVEWAFARNWTAKLEYDLMDFGSKQEGLNGTSTFNASGLIGFPPGFPTSSSASASPSVNQMVSEVKFGINYKFDSGFPF